MADISLEELILEFMPFSDELMAWCKNKPEFLTALKNVHPDNFISPAMIVTSNTPTGDEVIGVYSYHHTKKKPIFKQDFIVNREKLNKEFILYTRNPSGSSRYVKDINEFFSKYGQYDYTTTSHHLTIEQLPQQLQERALETIKLAEKNQNLDTKRIPQERINKIYKEVLEEKKAKWITKEKLRRN